MKRRSIVAALLLCPGLTSACSDDAPGRAEVTPDAEVISEVVDASDSDGTAVGDAITDTAADADVPPDAAAETSPDADTPPDVADTLDPDTTPDTTLEPDTATDAVADTSEPDAVADTSEPDAVADTTPEPDAVADTTSGPDAADTTSQPDAVADTTSQPDAVADTTSAPDAVADTTPEPDTATEVDANTEAVTVVASRLLWRTDAGFFARADIPVTVAFQVPVLGASLFAVASFETTTDDDGHWSVEVPLGSAPFTLTQSLDCTDGCEVTALIGESAEQGPHTPLTAAPPAEHLTGVIEPSEASKQAGGQVELSPECTVSLLGPGPGNTEIVIDTTRCAEDGKFLLFGVGSKIVVDTNAETVTVPVSPASKHYVATLANNTPSVASIIATDPQGEVVRYGERDAIVTVTVSANDKDGAAPTLTWLAGGGELVPVPGTPSKATWRLSDEAPWMLTVEARDAKQGMTRSTLRLDDRYAKASSYGNVVSESGDPLAGAQVIIGGVSTATDAAGEFEVAGQPRWAERIVKIAAPGKSTILTTSTPYEHVEIVLEDAPTFVLDTTLGGKIGDPDLGDVLTFGTSFVPQSGEGEVSGKLDVRMTVTGLVDNVRAPGIIGEPTTCDEGAAYVLKTIEVELEDAAGGGWEVAPSGTGGLAGIVFELALDAAVAEVIPTSAGTTGPGQKKLVLGSFDIAKGSWTPVGEAVVMATGGAGTSDPNAPWKAVGTLPKTGLYALLMPTAPPPAGPTAASLTGNGCITVVLDEGQLEYARVTLGQNEMGVSVCEVGTEVCRGAWSKPNAAREVTLTGIATNRILDFGVGAGIGVPLDGFPRQVGPLLPATDDNGECRCPNVFVQAPLPADHIYWKAKAQWLTRKTSSEEARSKYFLVTDHETIYRDRCGSSETGRPYSEFEFFRVNGMALQGGFGAPCDSHFQMPVRNPQKLNLSAQFPIGNFDFSVVYYSNELQAWHWAVGRGGPNGDGTGRQTFDTDPSNDDHVWGAVLLWYFDDEAKARAAFAAGNPYHPDFRASRATALSWRQGRSPKFYAFTIGDSDRKSFPARSVADHGHAIVGNVPDLCLNCHSGNLHEDGYIRNAYAVLPVQSFQASSATGFARFAALVAAGNASMGNLRSLEAAQRWTRENDQWGPNQERVLEHWQRAKDADPAAGTADQLNRSACISCHMNIDHLPFWSYETPPPAERNPWDGPEGSDWMSNLGSIIQAVCVTGSMPHSKQTWYNRSLIRIVEQEHPQPGGPYCRF